MRSNPAFDCTDPDVVRELIRANPWGIFVSSTDGGLVASHYPILLDESSAELAVLTHVGRPDDQVHRLGEHEILLIVQGQHGYVSPSWYVPEAADKGPTWNFSVAHCHGFPQILDAEANLRVLTRLVEHFERHVDSPMLLDPEYGARVARGTVGIRLPISRFECKVKLSQNKDPVSRRQVIDALRAPGPFQNARLAEDMEHADPVT